MAHDKAHDKENILEAVEAEQRQAERSAFLAELRSMLNPPKIKRIKAKGQDERDEHPMCDANCRNDVKPNPEHYMFHRGCCFCDYVCYQNFTGKYPQETSDEARARMKARQAQLLKHFLGI